METGKQTHKHISKAARKGMFHPSSFILHPFMGRFTFFVLLLPLLAACNFSLAADITPPPNYVSPTPAPTLGALYPASAPDIQNGERIYADKCAACHGETGKGDGEQALQLPVPVAPIGLKDFARKAIPARWYAVVTQGNLERFMPPFNSLSEQERWDVVLYALMLHTTPEQIATGKALVKDDSAFKDLKRMASLSNDDILKELNLNDDAYAASVYLRTLTFAVVPVSTATPLPTFTQASVTETPSTPIMTLEGTAQSEVTREATAVLGVGTVSGKIINKTGASLPSNLKITLRGFNHDSDAGAQEVLTMEGVVNADGTYQFENVEMPEGRIFLTEFTADGLPYKSGFQIVEPGMSELTLADVTVYATTTDYSSLTIDAMQIFFDYANADNTQAFVVYSLMNTSDKTIVVEVNGEKVIPFISYPEGAEGLGYEATQDSAPFIQLENGSFAMPPSEMAYSMVAYAKLPKGNKIEFAQKLNLSANTILIFLPEGVTAKGTGLIDGGIQSMQGSNLQLYHLASLSAGDTISFTTSGNPKGAPAALTPTQILWIGAGALGMILLLAGVWMYYRDSKRDADESDDDEFEDSESVMDAIIALDDLHRAGKIDDKAYKARREELKKKI